MLGQDRPEKYSVKCLIRSGEIPSPRQRSIDKTNDCAMKAKRGAFVRGSRPTLWSQCPQHGRWYDVAGAGQASDTTIFSRWCVENRRQTSRSLPDGKKIGLFQVWEKSAGRRGQYLAPETTDPPDVFEATIYIHSPCPTRSGLAVGWFDVEIEGLSSCELGFDQRAGNFIRENTNCAACSPGEQTKNIFKNKDLDSPVLP